MAHGQRDWSNVGADEVVHGLNDLAELAARMWSPNTHNREGNVLFMDSFEHGFHAWHHSEYGTGAEVVVSALTWRTGGYSCKLVAGSDGLAACKIFRKFPYPVLGRYGLEFSLLIEAWTKWIVFRLCRHDGTDEHQFAGMYRVAEEDLLLKDESGVYQVVIENLDLTLNYNPFSTVKLVADLVNDTFYRLIINETEYDLSAYPAYVFAADDSPNVRVDLLVWGDEGYNGFSYFDDVILTQNEPP